jgi:protein AbiQ
MDLRSLKPDSYARLSNGRPQVLSKDRGYGVVYLGYGDLVFALPLRSNLNHPYGFKTVSEIRILNGAKEIRVWNGIDYTKALVVNADDLEQVAFKTRDNDEYLKIKKNKDKIEREFIEYLTEYLTAIKGGEKLNQKFQFTTLQYFHTELGVP